jgi:hypothetical protein
VRRVAALAGVAVLGLGLGGCGGPASAPAALDEWTRGDHPLGRGAVVPGHAVARGRTATLRVAGTRGAELRSPGTHGDGRYEARLRVPAAPGAVTGFFLYRPPDLAAEVDVEVVARPRPRLLVGTYAGGRRTHHAEVPLPFDPAAAVHAYALERDGDAVRFTVDGNEVAAFTGRGVPTEPLPVYVNAWAPRWLDGTADGTVEVAGVSTPPGPGR